MRHNRRSIAARIIEQRVNNIDLVLNVQLQPDISTLPVNFEVDERFGKIIDESDSELDPVPDVEVEEEFGELRWTGESDADIEMQNTE